MERKARPATYKAPADWFTGDVYVNGIVNVEAQPPASLGEVHFTPGARTAWHSHAGGQVLYVVDGHGVVAVRDGESLLVAAGDVVHAHAGEWHFHGADADHLMTHMSITEPGTVTEWGDHVTDDEYHDALDRAGRSL